MKFSVAGRSQRQSVDSTRPDDTRTAADQNVIVGRYGTDVTNFVVAGAPAESLKQRAWFTPPCGLAGLSVADAKAVAKLLEIVVGDVEHGW